jgi:hypothetical protein
MPLANASKICRIYGFGNAVNVQSLDIGKPDIYHRKDYATRQPILVIFGHQDKKLSPTDLNFFADRYPAY